MTLAGARTSWYATGTMGNDLPPAPARRVIIFALVAAMALSACGDDPRLAPSLTRDLSVPPSGAAPVLPLADASLRTQADFDALEDRLLARMPVEAVLAIYEQVAETADLTARPADALLLQRLAMLHLRAGTGGTSRLHQAFEVADRLREASPGSPHALYLVAHISHLILRAGADNAFHLDAKRRDVAVRLQEHWAALLAAAPGYVGPAGRTADDLRADLAALSAALEALPAAAAPDTPTLERVDGEAPAESASRLSPAAVQARADLYVFESGSRGDRLSLCRDRDLTDVTTGIPGRWFAMRCGILMATPDVAMTALTALVEARSVTDPCVWSAQAEGASPEIGARFEAALAASELASCARPAP